MTQPIAKVFHSPSFSWPAGIVNLQELACISVTVPKDLVSLDLVDETGILLLDETLAEAGDEERWASQFQGRLLVIAEEGYADGQFLVPRNWPGNYTLKALQAAIRESRLHQNRHYLMAELAGERDKSLQLTNIGTALSAQTDINHLLTMILREGRNLACCDAGSLYLIDREDENQAEMVFKLTQCDSISFPFEEKRMPMNEKSISGVVALTGKSLNIEDVYFLPEGTSYGFNSFFDESRGYRSRSMLTLPMKNRNQEVIGVLQFINRKKAPDIKLTSTEAALENTIPFDSNLETLLKALASRVDAVWLGDHVCWTGVAGVNGHDLYPIPYTDESLALLVDRIRIVQDFLERPLILENASTYLTFTDSTIPEEEFLYRMAQEADCGLLLDVNNVYVSCRNHDMDPRSYLEGIPYERVVQFHLAGHTDKGTHCIDTHDSAVIDPVWELYAEVERRTGGRATLLEWDDNIPPFTELHAELLKAQKFRYGGKFTHAS